MIEAFKTLDAMNELSQARWRPLITSKPQPSLRAYTIGVLAGEGIGPELIGVARQVLDAVSAVRSIPFEIFEGGLIGLPAIAESGCALSEEVVRFCQSIFERGGAILAGAGGDRFVYDLRKQFDLFCKLNPLIPHPDLRSCSVVKPTVLEEVNVLVVRDNSGGVYQGQGTLARARSGVRQGEHCFAYDERQVQRLLRVAAAIAQQRSGKLTVVVKPNGIPAISQLWTESAEQVTDEFGIGLQMLEIDYAVFQLIQSPRAFDVIAAPNLFGDILADLGGVLLGSRGLCYGASFSETGAAVYQTNHGAAYDLAGSNRANPIAQVLALSMLLHESFGLTAEAALIEAAVTEVIRDGQRTFDIMASGCNLIGTQEMAKRIVQAIYRLGSLPTS